MRISGRISRWTLWLVAALLGGSVLAQEPTTRPEPIPALKPPKPLLAPTEWEQHRTSIVLCSLAGAGLLAGALWYGLRKRPVVPEPPGHRAFRELDALAHVPQQGPVLSRISRTVREYVTAAFELPREETTTTEFVALVRRQSALGATLVSQLPEFLRACDERKFSPQPPPGDFDAVNLARELIQVGEARRTELAAQAAAESKKQSA
jgi:hypothetical protein